MPTYSYKCERCDSPHEAFHSVAEIDAITPCPVCNYPMRRNAFALGQSVRGTYKRPLELQSMGFVADPADVAEHRSRFPNTELVMREGSAIPVMRSLGEKRAYMKAAGWADTRDYSG